MARTPRTPPVGENLPRRHNPFTRAIGRLMLHLFDWQIVGEVPNRAKFVAIAGPHTSSWDLIVGLMTIWSLDVHVHWMGKHTIFRRPFGWFFRALGGLPVNRSAPTGIVEQMADEFAQHDALILGLAPEGTRSAVVRWKTGFYRIARAAGQPILPAILDFPSRTVRLGPLLWPGDDMQADIRQLRATIYTGTGHHRRPLPADLLDDGSDV